MLKIPPWEYIFSLHGWVSMEYSAARDLANVPRPHAHRIGIDLMKASGQRRTANSGMFCQCCEVLQLLLHMIWRAKSTFADPPIFSVICPNDNNQIVPSRIVGV